MFPSFYFLSSFFGKSQFDSLVTNWLQHPKKLPIEDSHSHPRCWSDTHGRPSTTLLWNHYQRQRNHHKPLIGFLSHQSFLFTGLLIGFKGVRFIGRPTILGLVCDDTLAEFCLKNEIGGCSLCPLLPRFLTQTHCQLMEKFGWWRSEGPMKFYVPLK